MKKKNKKKKLMLILNRLNDYVEFHDCKETKY